LIILRCGRILLDRTQRLAGRKKAAKPGRQVATGVSEPFGAAGTVT